MRNCFVLSSIVLANSQYEKCKKLRKQLSLLKAKDNALQQKNNLAHILHDQIHDQMASIKKHAHEVQHVL